MFDLALLFLSLLIFASAMTKDELMAEYPNCTSAIERVSPAKIGDGICDSDSYVGDDNILESEGDYNILECGWDGGDCIVEGYPDCHVPDPSLIGNGVCDKGSWGVQGYYNTKECGGDGGDCPHPDGFPDCSTDYPENMGDGYCHEELNNKECGRDGGDCPAVEGYPDCYVLNPLMIGDFNCDMEYNTEGCGWDGGDCVVEGYPDCHIEDPSKIANGECESEFLSGKGLYNTQECGWDGGDCLVEGYPDCHSEGLFTAIGFEPEQIGDGFFCDSGLNTEECGWDGGDCLYEGYPDCHVLVDNNDDFLSNYGINEWIGNGICNKVLNSKECGWDGGDCDPQEQSNEESSAGDGTAPTLTYPAAADQPSKNGPSFPEDPFVPSESNEQSFAAASLPTHVASLKLGASLSAILAFL